MRSPPAQRCPRFPPPTLLRPPGGHMATFDQMSHQETWLDNIIIHDLEEFSWWMDVTYSDSLSICVFDRGLPIHNQWRDKHEHTCKQNKVLHHNIENWSLLHLTLTEFQSFINCLPIFDEEVSHEAQCNGALTHSPSAQHSHLQLFSSSTPITWHLIERFSCWKVYIRILLYIFHGYDFHTIAQKRALDWLYTELFAYNKDNSANESESGWCNASTNLLVSWGQLRIIHLQWTMHFLLPWTVHCDEQKFGAYFYHQPSLVSFSSKGIIYADTVRFFRSL